MDWLCVPWVKRIPPPPLPTPWLADDCDRKWMQLVQSRKMGWMVGPCDLRLGGCCWDWMGLGWGLAGLRKMQGNTVLHLPLLMFCDTPENLDLRPSVLSLALVPLEFLTLVSIMFSQLGLLLGLPTDSTVGGEWSWVRVRHRRATVHKRPYTGGGDTL